MGTQTIGDPGGVSGESPLDIGQTYVQVVNGDTVSLPIGTVVTVVRPVTATSTSFTVKRMPTTPDFGLVGVVSGAAIPVGGAGKVITEGVALVIMDGATTSGDLCLCSTTTAGDGLDSATATLGKTVGTVLQTLGSAGNAYVYVHKM